LIKLKIAFGVVIPIALMGLYFASSLRSDAFHEELIARGCEEAPDTRSLSTTYDPSRPMRKVETFEVKACGKTWEMVLRDVDGPSSEVEVTSVKEIKKP
jgi:hypothetical protein